MQNYLNETISKKQEGLFQKIKHYFHYHAINTNIDNKWT